MVETYTKGSQTDCPPAHTSGRQSFSPVGPRKAGSPEMMENGHFGKVDKSHEINEKDLQYIDSQNKIRSQQAMSCPKERHPPYKQ